MAEAKRIELPNGTILDLAGSGGEGHKYSTEEKVVGEWIDGRPIYEQTIRQSVTSSMFNITHDETFEIKKFDGFLKNNTDVFPLNFYWSSGDYINTFHRNNTFMIKIVGESLDEIFIIIQYTKSTD